jgi:hypothetical protein
MMVMIALPSNGEAELLEWLRWSDHRSIMPRPNALGTGLWLGISVLRSTAKRQQLSLFFRHLALIAGGT